MSNSKYILGIDPGLKGAIAFLRPDGFLDVKDMPTRKATKGNEIDLERLAPRFDREDILFAMLERQSARPNDGKGNISKTMEGYGILKGALAANYIKIEIVTPQSWKKALRVPKDKNAARARASELMPKAAHKWALASHDGRAEAAMIALYAAEQHGIEIGEVYTQ